MTKWLQKVGAPISGPALSFAAQQECTYTLTTSAVTTAWKVSNASARPRTVPMALPYSDNFSSYHEGQQVRFFTAESGSFEGAASLLDPSKKVMRQQVEKRPIEWEHNAEPYSFMGDNHWADPDRMSFAWSDYAVTVQARIAGAVAQKSGPISTVATSRIAKGVSGWQTGPTGVTPDQPAGTGGGGQKAVSGACLSRLSCAVGALVGQQDQCKAAIGDELTIVHMDNHLWFVGESDGTMKCVQPNGTMLCMTVSSNSKRNVTMEPCSSGANLKLQSWNVAALDPSSLAARSAHGGLQLKDGSGCVMGSKSCWPVGKDSHNCHGGTWVDKCNSSGWVGLDGDDAVQGPWFRVCEGEAASSGGSANCTLPSQDMVRVCGRISGYQRGGQPPLGYCLVLDEANWYLSAGGVASSQREYPRVIARGPLPAAVAASVAKRAFVELALHFKGDTVSALVGGVEMVALEDRVSPYGMVALGSGWHLAEFADLKIEPIA